MHPPPRCGETGPVARARSRGVAETRHLIALDGEHQSAGERPMRRVIHLPVDVRLETAVPQAADVLELRGHHGGLGYRNAQEQIARALLIDLDRARDSIVLQSKIDAEVRLRCRLPLQTGVANLRSGKPARNDTAERIECTGIRT